MNRIYNFDISAPSVADKVKGIEVIPNSSKGPAFRIEKAWIGFPNRDAIATGDYIGFQITTTDQDGQSALLALTSEYAVFTWAKKSTFTQNDNQDLTDYNQAGLIEGIDGTILRSGKKYHLNAICTGQDGADVAVELRFLGQYVSPKDTVEDWHDNVFS